VLSGVASRHVPRFDGPCPNSPAADPNITDSAGTFTTAMFMSGRLPNASAIRTTPIRGNGAAASIRARIRASIKFEDLPLTLCEGTITDLALKFPGVCVVRSWNALELEPGNRADT
jgi:hypothetical protein